MEADEGPRLVKLGASLTIDKAAVLKDELSAALSDSERVLLDVSAIEELDLSCLQVLYAAKAQAKEMGRTLHLSGQGSDKILSRLSACGFLRDAAAGSRDIDSALVGF
jgi:Anti-anti-sigma regulatory factor (antagonist of anti-sigma factor)